ncbi:hypothetical protein Bca101_010245 [Brassica carinata]
MPQKGRLSREEKGKTIAVSSSPTKDATVNDYPVDDFDLVNREAMRDTENMSLSQRLLVADSHKQIREERDRMDEDSGNGDSDYEDNDSDSQDSGGDDLGMSSRSPQVPRRRYRRVRFNSNDCRPTYYHPSGIFEELPALPPEMLRDPRAEGQN